MFSPLSAMRKAQLLMLFICSIALTSCQEDLIEAPELSSPVPALSSGPGFHMPSQVCGSLTETIVYNPQYAVGSATIVNDEANLYALLQLNSGFFIDRVYAYFGDTDDLPISENKIVLEEFPFMAQVPGGSSNYTIQTGADGFGNCDEVVIALLISQRDMFGNTIQQNTVWLNGNSVYDGYARKFCKGTC